MKVEYLIVSPQEGNFCNSKSTFNNLLQISDEIKISGDKLTFINSKKALELDYKVETEIIKDKDQRYFHVTFTSDNKGDINLFTTFLRSFRKAVEKLHNKVIISTLWDEISVHYITEAYPYINEIENLMRYVILKFMFINVGMDWIQTAIPSDLKGKIDNKTVRNNSESKLENYLYNADFSQLSEFLFSNYRENDLTQLDQLLKTKESESLTIDEIKKKILPKSNWDRYFSELINYDSKKLAEQWEQLNVLRIKIAHNKDFTKNDLDKVKLQTKVIGEKLNEAIKSLSKIKLDDHQKQVVINNSIVASIRSPEMMELENFGINQYQRAYSSYLRTTLRTIESVKGGFDYLIIFKNNYQIALKIIVITQQELAGIYSIDSAQSTANNIIIKIGYAIPDLYASIGMYNEIHVVVVLQMPSASMYDIQGAIRRFELSLRDRYPNLRIFSTTTNGSGLMQDERFVDKLNVIEINSLTVHKEDNSPN